MKMGAHHAFQGRHAFQGMFESWRVRRHAAVNQKGGFSGMIFQYVLVAGSAVILLQDAALVQGKAMSNHVLPVVYRQFNVT